MGIKIKSHKDKFLKELIDLEIRKLKIVGVLLTAEVKKSFKPGKGKLYLNYYTKSGKRRAKPIPHRASREGVPPAVMNGRLKSSIRWSVNNSKLSVKVGTNLKYGRRLELGFIGYDSKGRFYRQGQRSYLRRAYFKNRDKIEKIFSGA